MIGGLSGYDIDREGILLFRYKAYYEATFWQQKTGKIIFLRMCSILSWFIRIFRTPANLMTDSLFQIVFIN